MLIFEVRIPAFERPELLCRALQSLQGQTYPHWRATVYDDSQSATVAEMCALFQCEQISYVRNPIHLGAALNIDQCFSPISLSSWTRGCDRYACVLEDDNYWLPEFLGSLVLTIQESRAELILANQRIHEEGNRLLADSQTTRGDWFKAGIIEPLALRSSLLFMEGLSNGGVVWKLDTDLDLRVSSAVKQTCLHEACRTLIVNRQILFVQEALAVWSSMPKSQTARSDETNRAFNRGMRSIRAFLLKTHGGDIVAEARHLAKTPNRENQLVESVAYAGKPFMAENYLSGHRWLALRAFGRGCAISVLEPDPCAAFLGSSRPAALPFRGASDRLRRQ